MLYQDRIAKLGWPEYKGHHNIHYIMEALLKGYKINTRECRYIGIGNLHCETTKLRKKGFPFSQIERSVVDPVTGVTPQKEVLIIWMTKEQRQEWLDRNADKRGLRLRK